MDDNSLVFERFSERSQEAIRLAREVAHSMESEFVGTEHVLLVVLQQKDTMVAEILGTLNVDVGKARAEIADWVDKWQRGKREGRLRRPLLAPHELPRWDGGSRGW